MPKQPDRSRFIPAIAIGIVVILVCGLMWWSIRELRSKKAEPKRQTAQVIQVVRPPPPPPDQPPPPPPPEKVEEQIPQDTPAEKPTDDAPPQETLGLDADGSAGGDGFGLAARKGGHDLLGTGGSVFAWYTGIVKDAILAALSDDQRIRKGSYVVTMQVWLTNDGRIERVKVAQTSGDRERDGAIEEVLTHLNHMREGPPLEMPQPITLKIVSRG